MVKIKCECGDEFEGVEGKEDTCPKCLKELINPTKLGECPFCHSVDYTRSVNCFEEDFVRMDCSCDKCDKWFTEYYGLDEIKFDVNGEEFICNKSLSKDEKELIIKIINEWESDEYDNEMCKKLERIKKVMSGGLNRE